MYRERSGTRDNKGGTRKAPEGSPEKAKDDEGLPECSRRRSGNRGVPEGGLHEEMFSHGWMLSSGMEDDRIERMEWLCCVVDHDGVEDGGHRNGEEGVKRERGRVHERQI